MRQKCALVAKKASCLSGCCIKRRVASRLRQAILPLLTPGESCLECCGQSWGPMNGRDIDKLEQIQRRAPRWLEGWSTWSLRTGWDSWSIQPWEKKDWSNLIAVLSCLTGAYREARYFVEVHVDRTRGSQHKWQHRQFQLNEKKNSVLGGWSKTGTGCPERLWSLHLWRC